MAKIEQKTNLTEEEEEAASGLCPNHCHGNGRCSRGAAASSLSPSYLWRRERSWRPGARVDNGRELGENITKTRNCSVRAGRIPLLQRK